MNVNDGRTILAIEQRRGNVIEKSGTYLDDEMNRKARTADPTRPKRDLVIGEITTIALNEWILEFENYRISNVLGIEK